MFFNMEKKKYKDVDSISTNYKYVRFQSDPNRTIITTNTNFNYYEIS